MSTKNFTWFLFLFLVFNIQEAPAQFTKKVLNIMAGDSAATIALYDSIQTAHDAELFRKDSLLKESQLQQANLLMETETLRLQVKAMDSIKLARLKIQIDSLRKNTRGVPVVIEEDTLFYLYAKRGGNSPIVRAENIEGLLKKLAKKYTLKPDSIYIEPTEIQADIMYKDQVIVSVT
ncbi:MAG: mechanosensitive ion channel family protein, partial [Bacteroidales bacterium]